jgi:diguanylate cyclase (GGDEF)-like protein
MAPRLSSVFKFLDKFPNSQEAYLTWPAVATAFLLNAVLVGYALLTPLPWVSRQISLFFGLSGMAITIRALFYFLRSPRPKPKGLANYLGLIGSGVVILLAFGLHNYLMPGYTTVLGIILITQTAVLHGRRATYGLFAAVTLMATGLYLLGWLEVHNLWQEATLFFLISALLAETTLRLRQSYLRQMTHLDVLNRAAQVLASTIEYHQVVNLVCSLVQESIPADAYYMGLLQEDKLRLELIYDLGEYFPPTEVALEDTLVAHVIRRAQSLLINDMELERWKYKRSVRYVGQPRESQSWLGVPMVVGGAVIGVIVVSSYRKNAFSMKDVWLLENLARQTAMAIDNARHHQQVEQRAQLDSLTQVLNHNAFLETLERALTQARGTGSSLSLIMLDVDYFKEYNDAFGHLLGDQVLQLIIETIRQHIKRTDWVGRWGGEEFAIALPNATGVQAYQVAQRIRETLRQACFTDRLGNPVRPPTVSQGIAVFPDEADEVFALIDLADQRLYMAKSRGRDQVEPGADFWARQAKSGDELPSLEQGVYPLPDVNPER